MDTPQNTFTKRLVGKGYRYITTAAAGETHQLNPEDEVVFVDTENGACTILMPSVTEMQGRRVDIIKIGSGTNAATVKDRGNANVESDFWANKTLDTTDDRTSLYSNGTWWQATDNIA